MQTIGVVGAGAWGTALAQALCRAGRHVRLWMRDPGLAATITKTGFNPVYLPGLRLDPEIAVTTDLAEAMDTDAVLLVVPTQHLRSICRAAAPLWKSGVPAVLCSKGIETGTGALTSDVARAELPAHTPLAVLSGPGFADGVARGLPSAVTLACSDPALGMTLVSAIGSRTFRPYYSPDLVGVEVGGATKNVLAIACGILEGQELGENARAALLTRGLAEMKRLGIALGGRPETFMGLSGMGDLILTATSMRSRNFSLGVAMGQGQSLSSILAARRAVTEGVATAGAITALARKLRVEMPICEAVDTLLNHGGSPADLVDGLLARPFRSELDSRPRAGQVIPSEQEH